LDKGRSGPAARRNDLKVLLSSWFDVGFLEPKQITWDAPAALLEKLFACEAVQEIKSWDNLKNRLASDRRFFALSIPACWRSR
jgi:malonyl-CoA decarboxylase